MAAIASVPSTLTVYPLRLTPGMEILTTLQAFVKTNHLKAAFILTCCGSVSSVRLRFATGADGREVTATLDSCFEITSLVGTVCGDGAHLHATLGGVDGGTVSGHVVGGMVVQTTAEVVLGEAAEAVFRREPDERTGWEELVVKPRNEGVSN